MLLPLTPGEAARWATGAAVVLALMLGLLDGGYAASRWAPAGIALIWLLMAAWAVMHWPRPRGVLAVALGAYALLAVWTGASIIWADAPGRALDAAGRTAIYGLVLAVTLLPRWPQSSARRLLILLTTGATLVAGITLLRTVVSAHPASLFIDGRLIAPLGYVNATAGLWLIVLGPAVYLAAGGVRSPAGRALALAAVGVLVQTMLLSQSRGALLVAIGTGVVLLVLTPRRGATALVLAAVLVAVLPGAPTLLHVRGAVSIPDLTDRIDAAWLVIVGTTGALVVVGTLAQALLLRISPGARTRLAGPRVGNGTVAIAAVCVVLGGVVAVGNPVSWVHDRAHDALHGGYSQVPVAGDRLTGSLGSNRGDMYRVAWNTLREHPLRGIGAEDFQGAYLRDRRTTEAPRYAHSLPLGVLSGLGTVGGALWLVLLGALALGIGRARQRGGEPTRALGAAATAGGVAWLLHATVDWTWEFPALSLLGFVLLGVAVRIHDGPHLDAPAPALLSRPTWPRGRPGGLVVVGAVALAVAASVALGALGLSSRYARAGTAAAQTDPPAALRDLARAARLNPLDSDALLSRAVVARQQGDTATWQADLRRTLQRSPDDWFARLELGLALAQAGQQHEAIAQLVRAQALNPRQPAIVGALSAVRRGERPPVEAVEEQVLEPLTQRLRPTGGP